MRFKVLGRSYQAKGVTYKTGEVVETDLNLLRFNTKVSRVFKKVSDTTPTKQELEEREGIKPKKEANPPEDEDFEDDLDPEEEEEEEETEDAFDGFTLPELRELAKQDKVDLKGATKKEDVLKILRKHVAGD